MKRNVTRALLIAAAAGAMTLPAMAQDKGPPAPEHVETAPFGLGGHPAGPPRDAGHFGIELAARLSAQETYIGITPDQAAVWRAYTAALLAFTGDAHPGRVGIGPDGPRPPFPDAPQAPTGQLPDKLFAEHLAERAIAQGEKAEILQAAAKALREALSPAQLARLAEADMPPQRPMAGGPAPALVPHKMPRAN